MKGCNFVFESSFGIYYKSHKVSLNHGGLHIKSLDYLKKNINNKSEK